MAPLPLFHRPLSQDNSRETSLSSGRGGGRSTGPDTSHSGGSGSGVSLPMRGQTGVKTPNTPDTPSASTVISGSIPNAASSDYLIPLTGNMARPKNIKTHHRQSVTSHATTGTPVSSPSDEPASEESDEGSNQDETSSGRTHLRLKIEIENLKSDKEIICLICNEEIKSRVWLKSCLVFIFLDFARKTANKFIKVHESQQNMLAVLRSR